MSTGWIKRCGSNACIEVRVIEPAGLVLIRNSELPDVITTHTREEWYAFAQAVKAGDFDDLG